MQMSAGISSVVAVKSDNLGRNVFEVSRNRILFYEIRICTDDKSKGARFVRPQIIE